MPRPKLCGGWISNKALELLGFDLDPTIAECPLKKAEFTFAKSGIDFSPDHPMGVFVDRAEFDHCLVRHVQDAGADLLTRRVNSINQSNASVEVVHEDGQVQAGAAIICTGANSPLVQTVRELDDAARYGICIEQRLPVSFADRLGLAAGTARLHFGDIPFGYSWILHHDRYLVVGVGCRRSRCANIRDAFERFWKTLDLPADCRHPKGHMIPFGGFRRRLGRGRILTAGDAAGLVDPFNGEGISYAIRYGQLAAKALASSQGEGPLRVYEALCENEILPNLRLALWTARMYYGLPRMFIKSLCSDHSILAEYNEILEGRLDYKQYLLWAIRKRAGSFFGRS